tara:strand:+ start:1262 stop:1990 length:729 start_codon:yes stop_codon:yes gene_type:complete
MSIHLLFSGPIRPNIKCVQFVLNNYKKQFENYNIKTYLSTWNNNINSYEELNKLFDYVVINDEPSDEYIYNNLTEKTIQQQQLHNTKNQIDNWTLGIYKMFFGTTYLIKYINENNLIDDNDIVMRIRLDCIFELKEWDKLLKSVERNPNKYYVNYVKGCMDYSDWYGISIYKNIKNIWNFHNIDFLNNIVKKSFNGEMVVKNMTLLHNIESVNIKVILGYNPDNYIVRKFIDTGNYKKHYYE